MKSRVLEGGVGWGNGGMLVKSRLRDFREVLLAARSSTRGCAGSGEEDGDSVDILVSCICVG